MSGMASVIEQLLLAAVTGEKAMMPRRNRMDWVITALSVLLAVSGLFFLMLALDRYLEKIYPLYIAALVCGGVLISMALLATGLTHCCRARRITPTNHTQDILVKNITSLMEGAFAELEVPVQENPKTSMLLAAVAGFFMANRMNAR